MKDRNSFISRMGRTFGRVFLEFNIHPVLYVILLIISLLHTILAMLDPSSELYFLFEWADPSMALSKEIFAYMFIGLTLISAVTIIIMFGFAIITLHLHETTFSKYLIAISMTINLILYYPMLFPLIRSSIVLVQSSSNFVVVLVGAIALGLGLYFTYTVVTFLYLEQSPASPRLYATVQNPNALFVSNIFRLLLAIITSAAGPIYGLVLIGIFLPLMVISLFRYPFISCKMNTFKQALMSCVIWVMITRFIELAYGTPLPSAIVLVGFPIFTYFTLWLLYKRLLHILKNPTLTVKQFKSLYKMINQFDSHYDQLYLFLIKHYKQCEIVDCFCHKIFQQVNIKDQKLRKELKASEQKQLKRKQQEKILWYRLLNQFLNRFYNYEELKNISLGERIKKIKKMIPISVDRSEILYQRLNKRHTSLVNLWKMQEEMQKEKITNLTFDIRFFMLELRIQSEMETNFKKGSGIEEYTWNYYNFQLRLNQFRVMLFKIVKKIYEFWEELSSKLPDENKIIQLIERIYCFNQEINNQYRFYRKKSQSQGKSEYENRWNSGIKFIIDSFYIPYLKVIEGDSDSGICKLEATLTQFKKSQPAHIYSKDITFFDCSSGTAMVVINVGEGEDFGRVMMGNKQFWSIFKCPRYSNVTFCKFVLEQMGEWHEKAIKKFLQGDSYYLNYITGFIVDTVGYTIEVQFTVQVIPNIYNGLKAAGFARPVPQRAIFAMNKTSEVLIYTREFEAFILDKISVEEFDDKVTKQFVEQIDENGHFQLQIQDRMYFIHCVRLRHYGPEYRKIIYYCEILDRNQEEISMVAAPEEDLKLIEIQSNDKVPEIKQLEEVLQIKKQSSYLKQKSVDTKILQTIAKNKQAIKYIFSVVENDGDCKSIQRWFVASIMLLGVLVIVCVINLILIFPKSEQLSRISTEYKEYHNMMKGLIDSSYYARRININEYEVQPTYTQVKKLKQMNELLEESMKNTAVFSDMSIRSIKLSTDNVVSMSDEPLSAVLLKYIVSSYTYVSENPEPAFDYIKDQLSVPYTPNIVNFYSALYNNIYICEPYIREERSSFLTSNSEQRINAFENQINVMILIFGCLICFSVLIATAITSFKISGIKDFGFQLLATLKMEKIQERAKTVKDYSDCDLSDLIVTEEKTLQKNIEKEIKKKNQELERTMIEDMNQGGSGQLEITGRNLLPEKNCKFSDSMQSTKKKRNNLKITGTKKCEIFCKFFLVIFPALGLLNAMIILQFENNSLNQYKLQVRTLLDQRMEKIRLIKTYDQEIGLERDMGNIEGKEQKVADRLKKAILSLYEIEREIEEKLHERETALKEVIQSHSKKPVCQTFQQISKQEDEIITFTLEQCEELFSNNFISNGVPASIVFFLDTSTSFQDEYKNAENLTISEIRTFVLRPEHDILQKLTYFLSHLQSDLMLTYQQEFISDIKAEEQTMIILCTFCIVVTFLIFILGLQKFKKWMYYDLSLIKTIFHLLSYREIEQDQRLTNLVVEKKDDFSFIG